MGLIDRGTVRSAFHRRAEIYEEKAVVQKRVVERMVRTLRDGWTGKAPERILDIGAGTGMLLREVRPLFPDSLLTGLDLAPGMGRAAMGSFEGKGGFLFVEGDAERLPFGDNAFDLVLSTSTLQWLNTLEQAFSEALRVLAPNGTFRFALFGEETLIELRESYRNAHITPDRKSEDRTHRFFSKSQVKDALEVAGFSECLTMSILEREYHADVPSLLRSLRDIGAGNASVLSGSGLAGRRVMMNMMDRYRNDYGVAGRIPATYEVVYGEGRKRR